MITFTVKFPPYPFALPKYSPSFKPSTGFLSSFLAFSFIFSFEPAFWRAFKTASFRAFDDMVAPVTESTSTFPVLKISFIIAEAFLKYSSVSLWDKILMSVNFPFFIVILTVNKPP